MQTTLQKNTIDFLKNGIKTVAHSDQKHFYYNVNASVEKGLKMMIDGVDIYCEAHLKEYGSTVGNDGYLHNYFEEILHGIRGLFSGCGRFDGGTLDKTICEIAAKHNLEIE